MDDWLHSKHEIRMDIGIVKKDPNDLFSIVPDGYEIKKYYCPDCDNVKRSSFKIDFPIKCACGGLVHVDMRSYWDDYEYELGCDKCKLVYTFDPDDNIKINLKMFELLVRKNIILETIKKEIVDKNTVKLITEHLNVIYYNAPSVAYNSLTKR